MGIVLNIFTAALVVAVLALVIVRIRGQQKLGDAAENLECSRLRFSKRLDTLADVASNVDRQNLLLNTEFRRPPIGVGHSEFGVNYEYRTPSSWWASRVRVANPMIYPNTLEVHVHHGVSDETAWKYEWLEEDSVEYELAT